MTSFFGELRRRNVVRVAVAYAIVGWILVEVSSTVLPIFEAPDWIVQVFTFFVILGFPLALILSWAYEITPEGIKLERDVATAESITHVTGRKLDFAIIGLLLVAVVFLVVNYVLVDSEQAAVVQETITPAVEPEAESSVPVVVEEQSAVLPNSVAVLPFRNDSPDPDNAYYASGIHEEILNQLVKLSALNVIARTSVEQYRNTEKSIPEIARELNVETVMEGSVRYAGGQIRITAQLNDGVTGAHLWSETYTRDFEDIFAIESDVAMNVANALEAEFSLEEQESIEAIPTDSSEAYAFYLQAVSLGWGTNIIQAATTYLDSAIRLDSNFALAYARKALHYAGLLAGNVPDQQAEYEQIAQENADQALALDETLGSAHSALAAIHRAHWRWAEAEAEYELALRLNANDVVVLNEYARTKNYRGNYEEAVEASRRAVELAPLDYLSHYFLGISNQYARNYDAAAESFRNVIELNPTDGNAHAWLGYADAARGNRVNAMSELQVAEQIYGESLQSQRITQLAGGYAQIGRREEVERLFDALQARAESSPVNAALWALMYVALEDYDQALEWLEVAVNDQAPDLVSLGEIKANPYANPVLDEPRFRELRDRIGT